MLLGWGEVPHAELQCGHGHEAVENLFLGDVAGVSKPLQCGHGHEAVENGARKATVVVREKLQCGHGHEAVENSGTLAAPPAGIPSFNAATAMRPWRTRRSSVPLRQADRLQCGHGHEAVENGKDISARPCALHQLQCGHGHEAVENGPYLVADRVTLDGFNAATAMRPWRTCEAERQGCRVRNGFNAATAMRPWRTCG